MIGLAIGAALLTPAPSPADNRAALSLPQVLAHYRQAAAPAGGQALVSTRRVSGTTVYGGVQGTFVSISKSPNKYWQENKAGFADDVSGSDGKVSWHRDSNGNVRLLSAQEQIDERTGDAVGSGEFADPRGFAGTVTLRPKAETVTGCYVLDVTPQGGKRATLYLDPKTFLVVKQETLDDTQLTTVVLNDFKMLGGRLRATTLHTHFGTKRLEQLDTISSIEDGVPAPDALFATPTPAANYQWVTPGATSADLPFDDSDNKVSLYCAVNGRPTFLQMDSGAGGIAIALRAAFDMRLPFQGIGEGSGYGGNAVLFPIKMDTFEIAGGVVFSNLSATALLQFPGYSFLQATPTIGLLGYDLLSRFVVRVNYETQMLTLIDPQAFQPQPSDGASLPLDLDNNVPSVLASFDGLPPARFLVDTGNAVSTVLLNGPYVTDNHLDKKYPRSVAGNSSGIGGTAPDRRIRAHSFAIAGVTLTDVPTQLSQDTQGAGASRVLAGAFGTDFLSHFTITFDYAHSRLFFAPNAQTHKPFDTRTFGILVVQGIDYDTHKSRMVLMPFGKVPERDAKLLRAATLFRIDNQDAVSLGLGEVRRLLSPRGGKDTHDLFIEDANGRKRHVTVGLYDPMPPLDAK